MTAHPEPGPGEVLVRETPAGPFTQEVRVGAHAWTADEPPSPAATTPAPAPYDLLGAALGACISMTLRMYADRKGWPVESISVLVGREKVRSRPTRYADHARPVHHHHRARGDLADEQRARCSRSPTGVPCTAPWSTARCSRHARGVGRRADRGLARDSGLPGVRCSLDGRSADLRAGESMAKLGPASRPITESGGGPSSWREPICRYAASSPGPDPVPASKQGATHLRQPRLRLG